MKRDVTKKLAHVAESLVIVGIWCAQQLARALQKQQKQRVLWYFLWRTPRYGPDRSERNGRYDMISSRSQSGAMNFAYISGPM